MTITTSHDERVAVLEAKVEISELVARYSRCLDGRRTDEFLDLFAEDGVWDFGPTFGAAEGREQLERLFGVLLQVFPETHHVAGNVVVEVDGETATAAVDAFATATDTNGRQHTTFASYEDRFVHAGGAWRFARRTVTMHTLPTF
ncbi:MAG: nuclear transport factor 2 family protein [Acidimicrobiia bacterium]